MNQPERTFDTAEAAYTAVSEELTKPGAQNFGRLAAWLQPFQDELKRDQGTLEKLRVHLVDHIVDTLSRGQIRDLTDKTMRLDALFEVLGITYLDFEDAEVAVEKLLAFCGDHNKVEAMDRLAGYQRDLNRMVRNVRQGGPVPLKNFYHWFETLPTEYKSGVDRNAWSAAEAGILPDNFEVLLMDFQTKYLNNWRLQTNTFIKNTRAGLSELEVSQYVEEIRVFGKLAAKLYYWQKDQPQPAVSGIPAYSVTSLLGLKPRS